MPLSIRSTTALAATLVAAAACWDDPTIVERHAEVEGFALHDGTAEIYRYMLDDGAPPPLSLEVGTYEATVTLLDHDGAPLVEEEAGDEEHAHILVLDITDPLVLSWTPDNHVHDDPYVQFHGELHALAAGVTTLRLCVPHGAHCDFEVGDFEGGSGGISVTVTAPAP